VAIKSVYVLKTAQYGCPSQRDICRSGIEVYAGNSCNKADCCSHRKRG